MKIKIDVLEEDIEFGIRRSPCYCPIARSLTRNGYSSVFVGYGEIEANGLFARVPSNIESFMSNFDNDKTCNPFSFEIDLREKV